jgi:hypothetical protein
VRIGIEGNSQLPTLDSATACRVPTLAGTAWLPIRAISPNGNPVDLFTGEIAAEDQTCRVPTVSAIVAPRVPKGFGLPVVVSRAV